MRFEPLLTNAAVLDLATILGADQMRLVGGAVRDALAGDKATDLDVCTPLPPKTVQALLDRSTAFKAIPTGLRHGTVTAYHKVTRQSLEVTTLRIDQETDGRHATVTFSTDWRGDAARRDFTFNALMLDLEGGLHDYFDGQADLKAGRVRFIGDARTRLAEDWLRGLRYFRFWGRYGQLLPDLETADALREAANKLNRLSVERIWAELKGLILTPRALPLFQNLGFATALGLNLQEAKTGLDPIAAWALRLGPENDDLLMKLKASKVERDWFAAIRASARSPAPVFERQVRFGHEATVIADGMKLAPPPPFPMRAQDLLDQGFTPGPALGQMVRELEDRWIASEGHLTRDDLIKSIT